MIDHLAACVEATTRSGQPDALFRAIDRAMQDLIGHRLFTMMVVTPEGDRVRRIYTTDPKSYPVGGFKPMRTTPWGVSLMKKNRPYIGRDAADVRWAFFDHELLASLGLESVLNMPVVWDGRCIGTVNMMHGAGHFTPAHVAIAKPFVQFAVPAMLLEERR